MIAFYTKSSEIGGGLKIRWETYMALGYIQGLLNRYCVGKKMLYIVYMYP